MRSVCPPRAEVLRWGAARSGVRAIRHTTHTYTHTHTHTHRQTQTDRHAHTHNTHTRTHARAHTHTQKESVYTTLHGDAVCVQVCGQSVHPGQRISMMAQYVQVFVPSVQHTHTHTHTHRHIDTQTDMHTPTTRTHAHTQNTHTHTQGTRLHHTPWGCCVRAGVRSVCPPRAKVSRAGAARSGVRAIPLQALGARVSPPSGSG